MLSARALPSCAGRYMGMCEARSLHWHTHLWQGTHVHGWGGAGLGPETVDFQLGALSKSVGWNILRPEAVESICMLHRITNDTLYQDWGWQIFQAFEKYSKVSTESLLSPGNCVGTAACTETLLVTQRLGAWLTMPCPPSYCSLRRRSFAGLRLSKKNPPHKQCSYTYMDVPD